MIEELEAGLDHTEGGRGQQVNGTAAMEAAARAGLVIVGRLRAIMRVKLKNSPGLLAEWKLISRVHSGRADSEDPANAVIPPDGSQPPAPPASGGEGTSNPESGESTPPAA